MISNRNNRKSVENWNGAKVEPGECRDVELVVSESYSGMELKIPVHVRRGLLDGPVVFVSAALHGDEINGTGAIRALVQDESFELHAGSIILVPVLNIPGFDRHSRYLPDRRDLNRCFPGSSKGSLASRMARFIFDEIVGRADFGIDLHTAAVRRTNVPTIRADLSIPAVRRIAMAFGSELILNRRGPTKALRREACAAGCPTIVMEGGEVWKVEPTIVESALRGINNVLIELDMLQGSPQSPNHQTIVEKTTWVRAERGGFLQFYVAPGDVVSKDQPLAANTSLLGREQNVLVSPFDGVILGMTTLPSISPGEPVCHLGRITKRAMRALEREPMGSEDSLRERVLDDLAANVSVVDPLD